MDLEFQQVIQKTKISGYLNIDRRVARIVRLFIYFLALFFVLLLVLPWTPTVSGVGQLIAFDPSDRIQDLESPINGRVESWKVREGSTVKKGDLIAEIADIDPDRLKRLENTLDAIRERLFALEQQEGNATEHVARMKTLFERGIESERSLELAEIDMFKVISEKNKVKIEIQDLESKVARQSSQKLYASANGTVMNIYAPAQSHVVKVGEILAKIVPSDVKPAAELVISGKDLPLVRDDQDVRLTFEGWPAVQVVGYPSVAVGTFPGEIKVVDQGGDGSGNFRIIVIPLEDQDWPTHVVRMGSKVKGWIQLRTVPLWWELWRQFSGVPPRA